MAAVRRSGPGRRRSAAGAEETRPARLPHPETARVPRWELLEASFTTRREYANPFADCEMAATFRHGERLVRVDGFYDGVEKGRHVWRVRFAPDEEGEWEFATESSDADLTGRAGRICCTSPISPGGLATHPDFPHHFSRADGSHAPLISDGWFPHPGFNNEPDHGAPPFAYPSEAEMNVYLDLLARHSVSLVLEVKQLYARQPRVSDPSFLWPWAVIDAETCRIDPERFNLAYYQRLDRTLARCRARGIFYGLELLYDNALFRALDWSHHPWNAANGGWLAGEEGIGAGVGFDLTNAEHVSHVDRYLRYTLARTAAYWNVCFLLGAEPDLMARHNPSERLVAWYRHWGDVIAAHDPYGRLTSLGDAGELPELLDLPCNRFNVSQEHSPAKDVLAYCAAINRLGERFRAYGKLMVIGEMDRFNNGRYGAERRAYWTALASGFPMGRVDRHYALAEGKRLFESTLFRLASEPPIYADLKRMAEFVSHSGLDFRRMIPHDGLIGHPGGVYCLAAPGRDYLLYFVRGGAAALTMPEGGYTARWFNPRDGKWSPGVPLAGARRHILAAPDGEDWVLTLRREGS